MSDIFCLPLQICPQPFYFMLSAQDDTWLNHADFQMV